MRKWWRKWWNRFRAWLRRRRNRGANGPSQVVNAQVEMIMNNATVTWELPTTRELGGALDPSDIQHTLVSMSGDLGANFTPVATILPTDPQTTSVSDLDTGDWIFRIIVVDNNGKSSTEIDLTATVVDDSPPGPVVNATVVIS